MLSLDARLLDYDQLQPASRQAFVNDAFVDLSERAAFIEVATNQMARAIVEFQTLNAIPYEDYELLCRLGYMSWAGSYSTYVPAARGMEFADVQLTPTGDMYSPLLARYHGAVSFGVKLVCAYRARTTGQGVVVGRETMEAWLDAGERDLLELVVDPVTGQPPEAFRLGGQNVLDEICDQSRRQQQIEKRAGRTVAYPRSNITNIHRPLV